MERGSNLLIINIFSIYLRATSPREKHSTHSLSFGYTHNNAIKRRQPCAKRVANLVQDSKPCAKQLTRLKGSPDLVQNGKPSGQRLVFGGVHKVGKNATNLAHQNRPQQQREAKTPHKVGSKKTNLAQKSTPTLCRSTNLVQKRSPTLCRAANRAQNS